MSRTPVPMTARRKKQLGLGAVINVCAAVFLTAVGIADGLAGAVVLGAVEALFSAYVVWTYRRTAVLPDAH